MSLTYPHGRSEPVSDDQIVVAEKALANNRTTVVQRKAALALARGALAREEAAAAGQSLLARLAAPGAAAVHFKSLNAEISGLEALETHMAREVEQLRKRRLMTELKRSFRGRLWLAAGWALSIYCVWRVVIVST